MSRIQLGKRTSHCWSNKNWSTIFIAKFGIGIYLEFFTALHFAASSPAKKQTCPRVAPSSPADSDAWIETFALITAAINQKRYFSYQHGRISRQIRLCKVRPHFKLRHCPAAQSVRHWWTCAQMKWKCCVA